MIKIDCAQFKPQIYSSNLKISVSNSVVNLENNYILEFTQPKLPFDRVQHIELTSQHKITDKSRCFVEISPVNALSFGIDCKVKD